MEFKMGEIVRTVNIQERNKIKYFKYKMNLLDQIFCNKIGTIVYISKISPIRFRYKIRFKNSIEGEFPILSEEIKKLKQNVKLYKRILK